VFHDASEPAPAPWQPTGAARRPEGDDCLAVDLWCPDAGGRRPVLVWVHGGGYIGGDPSEPQFDAAGLARALDCVVVSIGYRTGAEGFLDLRNHVPGADSNVGLHDLIAGFTWLQENLAAFGGDPERVTVAGQSAGAGCVAALMCSPSAKGLFRAAICQSAPFAAVLTATEAAEIAAEFVAGSIPGAEVPLRAVPPRELADRLEPLLASVARRSPGLLAVAPVVDGDLLPDPPLSMFRRGAAAVVPMLAGTNRDECSIFRGSDAVVTDPLALERWTGRSVTELARHYPGYPAAAAATRLAGDLWFRLPTLAATIGHSAVAPTWCYEFARVPEGLASAGLGAIHGVESAYLFANYAADPWPWLAPHGPDAADVATVATLRKLWGAMVHDGRVPLSVVSTGGRLLGIRIDAEAVEQVLNRAAEHAVFGT
jgi:para-nitrobenzyl esterase